jgi:hypothetical protein
MDQSKYRTVKSCPTHTIAVTKRTASWHTIDFEHPADIHTIVDDNDEEYTIKLTSSKQRCK